MASIFRCSFSVASKQRIHSAMCLLILMSSSLFSRPSAYRSRYSSSGWKHRITRESAELFAEITRPPRFPPRVHPFRHFRCGSRAARFYEMTCSKGRIGFGAAPLHRVECKRNCPRISSRDSACRPQARIRPAFLRQKAAIIMTGCRKRL